MVNLPERHFRRLLVVDCEQMALGGQDCWLYVAPNALGGPLLSVRWVVSLFSNQSAFGGVEAGARLRYLTAHFLNLVNASIGWSTM
jgi:hypothetical protein